MLTGKTEGEHERILPSIRRAALLGGAGLIAIGLSFALLSWLNQRGLDMLVESQRTGRVAREARSLVLDRETGIREFLVSGQRVSLAPEIKARLPLTHKLDSLVSLTRDNASQQDRARAIRGAVNRWDRGWVAPILQSAADTQARAANNLAGKELFDSIRAAFDSFLSSEQRIFARRLRILSALERTTSAAIIIEILLSLTVLAWLARRATFQVRELIDQQDRLEAQSLDLQQQAAILEEQAIELEEQADEANRYAAELATTNASLETTIRRIESAEQRAATADEQHAEASSLLDFVLDTSPVGVALFDSDRRMVRANAAIAAMSGIVGHDLSGKGVDELATDDIVEVINPILQQVIDTGESVQNVPVTGADRIDPMNEKSFLCSFFPVRLPRGAGGVGAIVMETTQYRQLEEQLLQSQKMEAVGRLAGGVAHDFNNMLTAIMSYSELIAADMDTESQAAADMKEVLKAADKASALTRQLLAFSRQQVLRPVQVNVNDTVDGLRKMMKRLTAASIEVSCRLAPDLWSVTVDPTELERVIMNLVLNARDAMPEGGTLVLETSNVTIDDEYTRTHTDTLPGPYVLITVSDSGMGMSREVRDKLFDPFFTTKEKGKGTGLGLSSVYGIVKQSGGFIWVYSELNKGTTFKIYFPRIEEQTRSEVITPRRNRKVGGETILLVEDDNDVRGVATRILRRNGYRVLEASNGAEALRVCEAEAAPMDLIVTDIVMPEMGGSELAQRIRENQPEARILFTSGYTKDAVVRQSFLRDGEAFIEKPFTPAKLALKAREVLDSNNGNHAA